MPKHSEIEFSDYNGQTIVLTNDYYLHIIDSHGSIMTEYYKNWEDTLKNPDYTGESSTKDGCKIYVQQNNKKRNYKSKYLVIVVNQQNLLTSLRFQKKLNFIKNLTKH